MNRTLVSILFISLLLLQVSSLGVIYGYYALKKTYITEKYCINKTVQVTCAGKCFVDNWVDLSQQDTDATPPSVEKLPAFSPFLLQAMEVLSFTRPVEINQDTSFYQFNYAYTFLRSAFHPPELA